MMSGSLLSVAAVMMTASIVSFTPGSMPGNAVARRGRKDPTERLAGRRRPLEVLPHLADLGQELAGIVQRGDGPPGDLGRALRLAGREPGQGAVQRDGVAELVRLMDQEPMHLPKKPADPVKTK